jgi:hypothetical protein
MRFMLFLWCKNAPKTLFLWCFRGVLARFVRFFAHFCTFGLFGLFHKCLVIRGLCIIGCTFGFWVTS